MKDKIFLTLCVLLLLCPANSWAHKGYRIIMFTDSVMGGYQLQAQDTFAEKLKRKIQSAGYEHVEVINAAMLDATTAEATSEITIVVEAQEPDVIIVQLGFNDAQRGVVTTATEFNLNTIINEFKKTGAYIILVGITAPANADPNYSAAFTQVFYSVAEENALPLYPNAMEGIMDNPSLTLADGMHPNTTGMEHMVEALFPMVDIGLRWRYDIHQQQAEKNKGQSALP